MRKRIWLFIKRVAHSRVGHIQAVLSLCFVFIAFYPLALNHPQFASCVPTREEIYTITEILKHPPLWIFVVGVTYFPSMLLTRILAGAVAGLFSLSCYPTAKVEFVIFLVCSTFQWILIGYGIEWLITKRKSYK
jgi:hypothetical protein